MEALLKTTFETRVVSQFQAVALQHAENLMSAQQRWLFLLVLMATCV